MHTYTYLHRYYAVALLFPSDLRCPRASRPRTCAHAHRNEHRLGAQQSGSLTISNDAPLPVRVRAQLLDFNIDTDGTPQFAASMPSEDSDSCRSWLALNPTETTLNAGEQAQIRYTVRVPPSTGAGSYHCAAGFTTLPLSQRPEATGLRMAVRVVAAFYAVVGSPLITGSVKGACNSTHGRELSRSTIPALSTSERLEPSAS